MVPGKVGLLPGTEEEEVSLRGLEEAESGSCKHQGWIVPGKTDDIVVKGLETWAGKGGRMGEEEKEWLMLNISFYTRFCCRKAS